MLGQLVPCGGGEPIDLHLPKLLVGRREGCDVTLRYGTVSSQHCRLEFKEGSWFVEDLGSRNGIRVNGTRTTSARLQPGDVLWIAQHRFDVLYAAETDARVPQAAQAGQDEGKPGPVDARPQRPGSLAAAVESFSAQRTSQLGSLVPCGGGDAIPLLKPRLIVGRSPGCDITLSFPTISSRHCALEFKEGYWFVRDLGSRNGIRVNGIRQQSKYLLPGEVLAIAKQRYEVDYEPQADQPPPEEDPFALSLLEKAGLQKAVEQKQRPSWMVEDGHVGAKKWTLDD